MRKLVGLLLVSALLSFSHTAMAGALEDGVAAYERRDYATAHKLWRPLAESGNASAQFLLGGMYVAGEGVAEDFKEALKWYRLAAEQGQLSAQYVLGGMYVEGMGVTEDFKEAVKWYRLAAERGFSPAQFKLAGMYASGRGVPQDNREAANWYRLAAEQGHAVAQLQLGLSYDTAQGAEQDYKAAAKWYRLSAEQGNALAQYFLGGAYLRGQGVVENYGEAMKWYRLSAESGFTSAQSALGMLYENGIGVSQDYVRAHMWFNLVAASLNGEDGKKAADKRRGLSELMTPAQIAQAQAMARTCQQSKFKDCGEPETKTQTATAAPPTSSSATSIPMKQQGGTFVIPVLINSAISLNFVVDSGAADVTIPSDVVAVMVRTGTLTEKDFGPKRTYVLADGSRVESRTFRIRSLKVGDKVVEDVSGSEAHVAGALLLGQSFLRKFKSWSIDNTKHALVLE